MNPEPDFAFCKKLSIAECHYGDKKFLIGMINRLFFFMEETNKKYGVESEFFRLDFRSHFLDEQMEFPINSLILDMKWGSKKELQEKECKTALHEEM